MTCRYSPEEMHDEIPPLFAAMDKAFDAIKFDPPGQDSGAILNPPGLTMEKLAIQYEPWIRGERDDPPTEPAPHTYRDAVADLLRSRPGEWIDGQEIARVGGAYAWRTRVSDARLQLGLDIENRQRRVGRRIISEYRIRPAHEKAADYRIDAQPEGR